MVTMEQKILDAVEAKRQDIIDFFQKTVQIPSLPGEEKELGDFLVQEMRKWGIEDIGLVEKEPGHPNVLARIHGVEDGPNFIFNGHLDVIHPGDPATWSDAPFSGKIKDGRIYGRGSVDMKGGTMSSFMAGAIVKQLGIPLKGNVLLTAVCDEEICGERGILYLLEEGYIKKQREDDIGLNCEPTDLNRIVVANKGVLRADVTFHGKSAHGARPWMGANAIEMAVDFIMKVRELADKIGKQTHPLVQPPTILIALIEGGSATNLVPDTCKVTLTRRLLPCENKEQAIKDYEDILAELAAKDPNFKADLHIWKGFRPPVEVPTDTKVVQVVKKAHQLVRGEDLPFRGGEGGTDASHVVHMTGLPMPVYGPGDVTMTGCVDENVPIDDVVDAVKVYALAIYYALGLE